MARTAPIPSTGAGEAGSRERAGVPQWIVDRGFRRNGDRSPPAARAPARARAPTTTPGTLSRPGRSFLANRRGLKAGCVPTRARGRISGRDRLSERRRPRLPARAAKGPPSGRPTVPAHPEGIGRKADFRRAHGGCCLAARGPALPAPFAAAKITFRDPRARIGTLRIEIRERPTTSLLFPARPPRIAGLGVQRERQQRKPTPGAQDVGAARRSTAKTPVALPVCAFPPRLHAAGRYCVESDASVHAM